MRASSPVRSEQTSAITISTKLFPTREKKAVGAVTCTPVSLPSTPLRSPPLRSVPLPSPAPRAKTTFTTDVPFRGVHRRSDLDEGTSCPPRRCLARFRLTPTFLENVPCRRVNFIRRFYRDRVIYDRQGKTEDPTGDLPSTRVRAST